MPGHALFYSLHPAAGHSWPHRFGRCAWTRRYTEMGRIGPHRTEANRSAVRATGTYVRFCLAPARGRVARSRVLSFRARTAIVG